MERERSKNNAGAQRTSLQWNILHHRALFAGAWRALLLGGCVGCLAGAASAIFLLALEYVTTLRTEYSWLIFLLPVAGVLVQLAYHFSGKEAERGNNLVIDEVIEFRGRVPLRMAPLVLFGTLMTHLTGGSAGREGTAVQMGSSLAQRFARLLRLTPEEQQLLLMSGMSGGFGAVFGTPLAGAVFGMEVITIGKMRYAALLYCLFASVSGDIVCRNLGVHHHVYSALAMPVTVILLLKVLLASLPFAGVSIAFSELVHRTASISKRLFVQPYLRPFVGGLLIVGLYLALGTSDYLGLGLPLLERSFSGDIPAGAFAWKMLFTVITLGFGYKGGEVTPLFVIGATLGAVLAPLLGLPQPFLAAVGFVAVFASASNTPITSTLMGIELFGSGLALPIALASFVSYILAGHRGIYSSQTIEVRKDSR